MKNKKTNYFFQIAVIALLVFILLKTSNLNQGQMPEQPITPTPDKVTEYVFYDAKLSLNPNNICSGDLCTGAITSNIHNGICSIFMDNGAGYYLFANVNLDSSGYFSHSQAVNPLGTANFIAVCCDANRNCKLSNIVSLTVRSCDSDHDGNPDETDPDDDNDGYPDEQEIEEGTDPKDPASHPGAQDVCDSFCVAKGYASGRGPYDSMGWCDYPEIAEQLSINPTSFCCCMPEDGMQSFTCGQGNDAQCAGTCPASYPYCLPVYTDDLYIYSCMCVDSNGQSGNIHPDWKPGGSMYNTHDESPPEPETKPVGTIFITSQGWKAGEFGGITGAKSICQGLANSYSLGGTWDAIISVDTNPALNRVPETTYYNMDGSIIANNKGDLFDGTLDTGIIDDETGNHYTSNDLAWTGSGITGQSSGYTCNSWSSSSAGVSGTMGHALFTDSEWIAYGDTLLCSNTAGLYCIRVS